MSRWVNRKAVYRNSVFPCPAGLCLVYLATGGTTRLDFFTTRHFENVFSFHVVGGRSQKGTRRTVSGGAGFHLWLPPIDHHEYSVVIVHCDLGSGG